MQSDLAQDQFVPLNGWESAQLVNIVFLPQWLQCLVLLPFDKTLHQTNTLFADFIRAPKGMEATMNHQILWTLPKEGGMGVRQLYWGYRTKYVTSMQQAMRAHPEPFPFFVSASCPCTKIPHVCHPPTPYGANPGSLCSPCAAAQEGPTCMKVKTSKMAVCLPHSNPR